MNSFHVFLLLLSIVNGRRLKVQAPKKRTPSMEDVAAFMTQAEMAAVLFEQEASKLPNDAAARKSAIADKISRLGSDATDLADESEQSGFCPVCPGMKDWNASCPLGWQKSVNNFACFAPASYAGDCARKAYLSEFNFNDKKEFEENCNVCWPCHLSTQIKSDSAQNGPIDPVSGRVG
eukprot:TRINITY_DN3188_c0_g1_i1.p1 TRINITY_DN3188_c0_g1~~TRINITY_DN3188_c0_g1_i1.p1  ORF type:complete len:178 (-),score=28.38 TRINITY_DN3188_c0_g1_i1:100-633(-)